MQSKMENTDIEIESLGSVYDVITIYLGEKVIPEFKKNRVGLY